MATYSAGDGNYPDDVDDSDLWEDDFEDEEEPEVDAFDQQCWEEERDCMYE